MRAREKLRYSLGVVVVCGLLFGACYTVLKHPQPITRPPDNAYYAEHPYQGRCTDCHVDAETGARAGMPTMDACLLCHDAEAEAELPREKTPQGFVLPGDEEPTWTRATMTPAPTTLPHERHPGADRGARHRGLGP